MNKITDIKEVQSIELEMMKFIDELCRGNNLKYYLAYGTLIGAVRHKGFIPWDDDIDIIMPRPDYEKLIKLMEGDKKNYSLVCVEKNKDYNYPWAKMVDTRTKLIELGKHQEEEIGIWIDIFPVDGLGNDKDKAVELAKKMIVQKYRIWTMHAFKNKGIKGRIMNIIGRQRFNKLMLHYAKKNNFYNSQIVGCIAGWDLDELTKGEYYHETCEVDFEGCKFFAPKGYHELLTMWYGDYMKLPPEEERVPGHETEIYWK